MSEPTVNFTLQTQNVRFSVPAELIKKNFKQVQKLIEKLKKQAAEAIATIKNDPNVEPSVKLAMVQKISRQVIAFQKKLSQAEEKDKAFRSRLVKRADHIQRIQEFTTRDKDDDEGVLDLHNDGLISWYREENNVLIVDYLLKSNTCKDHNMGTELMKQLDAAGTPLSSLIDVEVYEMFNKVFISINEDHDLEPITAWFNENQTSLKRIHSNLPFEIHLCKFLSMIEKCSVYEAIEYCKCNLATYCDRSRYDDADMANYESNVRRLTEVGSPLLFFAIATSKDTKAALNDGKSQSWFSLLDSSFPESNFVSFGSYSRLMESQRWNELSRCFITDFTKIYNIPQTYPLLVHLSAGLSSLKTKSCYCNDDNTIFKNKGNEDLFIMHLDSNLSRNLALRGPNQYYKLLQKTNECPVCSPELFRLSQNLPYTQLVTSIFENPFKLPNGNIYPFDKLLNPADHNELLIRNGKVKDPLSQETFFIDDCVRVFPA